MNENKLKIEEVEKTLMKQKRLDWIYQRGYEKTPETPDIGEAQIVILKFILPNEKW